MRVLHNLRDTVKQNITLSVDKNILQRARVIAAERGMSVSSLLAEELRELVTSEQAYEQAKSKALSLLDKPFHLGGQGIKDRDALHDRARLR